MSLTHEVPTGLRVRPTVTIRHIPGRTIRLPARAGTLLLAAALLWGALASLTQISWLVLAGAVLAPAGVVAALVELRPRGRTPLAWAYVLARHARRPLILIITRAAVAHHPGAQQRRASDTARSDAR